MVMMKSFQLSMTECADLIVSVEAQVKFSKDLLSSDFINPDVRRVVFQQAVDEKTLLLRLRNFLQQY